MRLRLLPSFVLAAAVVAAPAANAATITQTFTQPTSATTWSVANIPFNQFNASLGTLNSVTLQFSGVFSQTEVISVAAGVPAQTITGLTAFANVYVYGGANFVNQIVDITGSQNVISFPGVTIAAGTTQAFSASGALAFGPASQLPIAPYIGLGTKSLSLAGTGGFSVSGGGQANFNVTTRSGGTLSLVYDYTPGTPPPPVVPEPSSMLLLGAAAVAGVARRLRRK